MSPDSNIENAFIFDSPLKDNNIYEILLDNIYGHVIIKDIENKIIWVNNNAKKVLAKKGLRYVRGLDCKVIWQDDIEALERLNSMDEEVLSSGHSKMGVPLVTKCDLFCDKEGKCTDDKALYRVDKIPYMNSAGEIQGVVTFLLDTTHALDYQIKKYIDDVTYHELRSKLGNIIKDIEVKI